MNIIYIDFTITRRKCTIGSTRIPCQLVINYPTTEERIVDKCPHSFCVDIDLYFHMRYPRLKR